MCLSLLFFFFLPLIFFYNQDSFPMSASFLISLFRCGDLVGVGLDLGLADVGINIFDVCLVVDVSFHISLFRCGDLAVVGLVDVSF